MPTAEKNMSASLEDYLEAIYFLGGTDPALDGKHPDGERPWVRVTDIAEELHISKPSVNRAINSLKRQGLVEHEHYGALSLTDAGFALAENIAFRHITLKRFLTRVLGVEDARAEEEACGMEHALCQDTVEKLADYLKKEQDI